MIENKGCKNCRYNYKKESDEPCKSCMHNYVDYYKPMILENADNRTVRWICEYIAEATRLCIIRECGWVKAAVWVDYEDIFVIPEEYTNKIPKSIEYGEISIKDAGNVPCIYIDVE